MAQQHRIDVTPTAKYLFELNRATTTTALLEKLWRESTHFALVRSGKAIVDEADVLTPTAELRRLMAAVSPVRSELVDAMWVTSWPGTVRGGANFWLRGRAGGESPFPLDAQRLWRGWGDWEDLQLFNGSALQLFVSSHEGFGVAWAAERLFQTLGIHAQRVTKPVRHEIVGTQAARALLKAISNGAL
jgi:hypothetical protein